MEPPRILEQLWIDAGCGVEGSQRQEARRSAPQPDHRKSSSTTSFRHPCRRRAYLTSAEHFGDRVGISAEQGFHATVAAVANPAIEAECSRFIFHPRPKAHPLNAAFDADMYGPELR